MAKQYVQMDMFGPWEEEQAKAEEPGEFTDGITADSFEKIVFNIPKKLKITAEISLACGSSGAWYGGRSVQILTGDCSGNGYAAWPKFSKQYPSRYAAFHAMHEEILDWLGTYPRSKGTREIDAIIKQTGRTIDPVEHERYSTCAEWRECGFAEKCFAQDLAGDVVCFQEVEIGKATAAKKKTLGELCHGCKSAHPSCDRCCATCTKKCNSSQRCSWPGA